MTAGGTAGIDWSNVEAPTTAVDLTQTTISAVNDAPTTQDIVDAIWDEPLAGHLDVGSTGAALDDAGAAGDPWSTALPGSYTGTQAGKIVGDNLNATVTSRLAPTTAGRTLDVSVAGNAGIDWANIENPTTAVVLSGTNIDPDQVIASVTGAVGSVTGAVGSVTGAVGSVTGAVGSVTGAVGSVTGSVGSVVAQVNANIDQINGVTIVGDGSGTPFNV